MTRTNIISKETFSVTTFNLFFRFLSRWNGLTFFFFSQLAFLFLLPDKRIRPHTQFCFSVFLERFLLNLLIYHTIFYYHRKCHIQWEQTSLSLTCHNHGPKTTDTNNYSFQEKLLLHQVSYSVWAYWIFFRPTVGMFFNSNHYFSGRRRHQRGLHQRIRPPRQHPDPRRTVKVSGAEGSQEPEVVPGEDRWDGTRRVPRVRKIRGSHQFLRSGNVHMSPAFLPQTIDIVFPLREHACTACRMHACKIEFNISLR